MYDIINESLETRKEIEIRGRYMMLSADLEYCLLNIILYCAPDPNNHRVGQFKGMNMGGKIFNVICDMKKYKPLYYRALKDEFDGLEEFKQVRNHMAHCIGTFPNAPDLSLFRVTFADKDENGIEAMKFEDYTEEYIKQTVDRFSTINAKLAALWKLLYNEFNGIKPLIHPSKKV